MMKRCWLLSLVASGALAQEPMLRLDPLLLEIPLRIGPLQGDPQPHRYPQPGLGVSYQYNMPGAALTVYLYDADQKELKDGPDTIPVCLEFEFAKQGVMQAYQSPRLVKEQMVRLLPPDESPLMREAVYELRRENRDTVSFVWITAVAKHFVKLRFSADARLRDELPDARRAILGAFGAAIKPHLAPVSDEPKPGATLGLNLSGDQDLAASSLMYTMFLTALVDEAPEAGPVCGGPFIPPYDTELSLYRTLFAGDEAMDDSKFARQIAKVADAGFLEEFVWVDLHRDSWGNQPPEGLTLADYGKWKKKNLKRFKRPSFGTVNVDHPRPLPVEPPL